ncbi:MAG: SoxR reducing system RseC family protein [Bacteroidota bacterium]|nr:SoxR reducing system RseC family protein [Bacteroidota bacterium]
MSKIKLIEHDGVIESVLPNKLNVRIIGIPAGKSGHLKGLRSTSDVDEKIIEVFNNTKEYNVGDKVKVALRQSLGFKALFLGYVFPFILVLLTLIITTSIFDNEAISGLISLSILAPYYLGLYSLRNKISNIFTFSIKK